MPMDLSGLSDVATEIQVQVKAGRLTQAEADGVLQTVLDRNAPAEPGEVLTRRVQQMDKEQRKGVEEIADGFTQFQDARLARARAALLAISDDEWEEAGGSVA